ncbi:MAG: hypothetical protein PHV13_02310, partial [Candidatus ainarchaeum sp.]|nr:hypothetical protein [Candidatus ainarchaeum sp.]
IIYSAILGAPAVWDTAWPAGEPKPPEVFLGFLETVAHNKAPGEEGAYIADILSTLVSRNTMHEERKVPTYRNIGDAAYIDAQLSSRADRQFERTVACFKDLVCSALATPSTEFQPELEAPGYGMFRPGVSAAYGACASARDQEAAAKTAHAQAVSNKNQNNNPATQEAERQAAAAVTAATAATRMAFAALVAVVPELQQQGGEQVLRKLVADEHRAFAVSKEFEKRFRILFMECRADGKDILKDEELKKLGDNGHPIVASLAASAREIATLKEGQGVDTAGPKIAALERSITDAHLPQQVITELMAVTGLLRNPEKTRADAETEIAKVEGRYCYPVRKAVAHAMRKLAEAHAVGEVSDEQWITARLLFQGAAKLPCAPNINTDRWWARFWNDVSKLLHGEKTDRWYLNLVVGAVKLPYYPVKWFWKATIGNENFKAEVRDQHSSYVSSKDGKPHKNWWKRKHAGALQAATAVAFVAELARAIYGSVDFSNDFWEGIRAHFFRFPTNWVSVAPGTAFRSPLEWFTPQPGPMDTLQAYNDDPNLPDKLKDRPDTVYKSSYNVGNDSAKEAKARLRWLRAHPGVLQFMQERTTGVHVNGYTVLPKLPSTLRYDTIRTGPSKMELKKVWRLLRMDTVRIQDGLVLNRANADAFIDTLRAMEKAAANGHIFLGMGAKKIDYAYMTARGMAWEDNGFLVTAQRRDAMERLRIKDNNNALFVTLQPGVADSAGQFGLRAKLGVSGEYIENPDAFVALWRQNVKKITGEDPTQVVASPEALRQAFDSTRAALWGTAIRGAKAEFEEAMIMRQVGALNLGEATTNMLRANTDVRELLMQFGTRAAYRLNPARMEQFVHRVVAYKQNGGDVKDYSPFTQPQGKLVGWALGQGYFTAGQFKFEEPTGNIPARKPQAGGVLGADAQAFYAGAGATELNAVLDELNADNVFRQKAYSMAVATDQRAINARRLGTITVSGSGSGMEVKIADKRQAKRWLSTYAGR